MFRLGKTDENSRTVFTLEGQLAGDFCIEVVENCCNHAISTGKTVELFLRDVATIDERGQAMLRRLTAKGVRLRACYLLHRHGRKNRIHREQPRERTN